MKKTAADYARALTNTNKSLQAGLMTHATWKSHMASLWGAVDHAGMRYAVTNMLAETQGESPVARRSASL